MRLYELTRSKVFLQRGCALIFAVSILLCWIVQFFRSAQPPAHERDYFLFAGLGQIRERYQRLRLDETAQPEKVAAWLRDAVKLRDELALVEEEPGEGQPLSLFNCDVTALMAQHGRDEAEQRLFTDYAQVRLLPDNAARESARQRLQQKASGEMPPRFANQFHGDVEAAGGNYREALRCYLREMHHADAVQARRLAFNMALHLEDTAALLLLARQEQQFSREVSDEEMRRTAMLLDDRLLLWRSHWRLILQHWAEPVAVIVALFACLIWGVILFCSGNRQKRTLGLCAGGLLAGVLSVWLLRWWLDTVNIGLNEEAMQASMGHQLLHWVMYVGVPEEAVKLLALLPFLPLLLARLSESNAALLGGFVGLGFALEENLQYFNQVNESVALGRLLTANVLHFTLTGIVAWQLRDLLRSRFHRATDFLVTFILVALAHGLYDFFVVNDDDMWGTGILSIIILALCARHYLRHLPTDEPVGRKFAISRTCVFLFGASLLSGMVMLVLTLEADFLSLPTISPVLYAVLSLIPVSLLFVREFDEVHG